MANFRIGLTLKNPGIWTVKYPGHLAFRLFHGLKIIDSMLSLTFLLPSFFTHKKDQGGKSNHRIKRLTCQNCILATGPAKQKNMRLFEI